MVRAFAAFAIAASLGACGHYPGGSGLAEVEAWEDRAFETVTTDQLQRFSGEADFEIYLEQLEQLRDERDAIEAMISPPVLLAQAETPCLPEENCPEFATDAGEERITVTGSRVASPPTSITNNQTSGVDEGDVVKQIGAYLLVLQDGRVSAIDTRGGIALTDRLDVYRDPESGAWYDEMLVKDDYILITGYSYEEDASELAILSLDQATGRLRSEGVFLITSDDYYSADNYATRIVGGRLIIHTPYEPDGFFRHGDAPAIRRWLPEDEREAQQTTASAPLFDAAQIYRPVQDTLEPAIHSISICELGAAPDGASLDCETTAFVAPRYSEMFVSEDDVFLWTWRDPYETGWVRDCDAADRSGARRNAAPAAIFRLSMKDRGLTVAGASGAPFDQFSMDSRDGEFRGLADWTTVRCYPDYDTPPDVTLMRIPDHSFSPSFADAPDRRFTALPRPDARVVENRFADDWLVYGARDGWWSYPPEADAPPGSAELFAVSLRDPDEIWALPVRHEISRIERLGDGIILTGYRDAAGLSVSLVHLGRSPRVISSTRLDGRFESEGRSHAFNGSVGENGEAVMGLPTTPSEDDSGRYYWRSDYSDVSFLARTAGGRLAPLGELNVTLPAIGEDGWPMEDPDNECEVSCTDWYGNTRPIFIDGRIFGLMGLELVEGVVEDGSIREIGRLDFSAPPPAAAAPLS